MYSSHSPDLDDYKEHSAIENAKELISSLLATSPLGKVSAKNNSLTSAQMKDANETLKEILEIINSTRIATQDLAGIERLLQLKNSENISLDLLFMHYGSDVTVGKYFAELIVLQMEGLPPRNVIDIKQTFYSINPGITLEFCNNQLGSDESALCLLQKLNIDRLGKGLILAIARSRLPAYFENYFAMLQNFAAKKFNAMYIFNLLCVVNPSSAAHELLIVSDLLDISAHFDLAKRYNNLTALLIIRMLKENNLSEVDINDLAKKKEIVRDYIIALKDIPLKKTLLLEARTAGTVLHAFFTVKRGFSLAPSNSSTLEAAYQKMLKAENPQPTFWQRMTTRRTSYSPQVDMQSSPTPRNSR